MVTTSYLERFFHFTGVCIELKELDSIHPQICKLPMCELLAYVHLYTTGGIVSQEDLYQ